MAIKTSRLWSQGSFLNLSTTAKLFYLYATTFPSINSLGIFNTRYRDLVNTLGVDEDEVIRSAKELKGDFLTFYGNKDNLYVLVIGHHETLPASEAVYKRALKDIDKVPPNILGQIEDEGNMPKIEDRVLFTAPSVEEVEGYALSLGFPISGKTVVEYYEGKAKEFGKEGKWIDSRGKTVRDWKAKVRKVWCRNVEKLQPVEGSPKGYEFFSARNDSGEVVRPNRWKNNKPYGSGLLEDKILQMAYFNAVNGNNN